MCRSASTSQVIPSDVHLDSFRKRPREKTLRHCESRPSTTLAVSFSIALQRNPEIGREPLDRAVWPLVATTEHSNAPLSRHIPEQFQDRGGFSVRECVWNSIP